jgi:hypothetical protein
MNILGFFGGKKDFFRVATFGRTSPTRKKLDNICPQWRKMVPSAMDVIPQECRFL